MALTLIGTTSTSVISSPVKEALSASIKRCGQAVLLVDTFDAKQTVLKLLASDPVLSLGLTVATLSEWTEGLWKLFGDDRQIVSKEIRRLLILEALESFGSQALDLLDTGAGTVRTIERLAQGYLFYAEDHQDSIKFSLGQQRIRTILSRYLNLVHTKGFLEKDESYVSLISLLPQTYCSGQSIVISGIEDLSLSEEDFLYALSQHLDVRLILSTPQNHAGDANRELLERLSRRFGKEAVFSDDQQDQYDVEIGTLLRTIFLSQQEVLKPQGRVVLLSPTGVLAEPALVVEHIQNLIARGVRSIGIYVPHQSEAWQELAPRLAAQGIRATGSMRQSVAASRTGRAFLGFVRAITKLKNLCETWPDPSLPRLGDMSWWPPHELTDFLLSPVSRVSVEKAWNLDKSWRSDRILTPAKLLRSLRQASLTSKECADAVENILNGRVGTAARRLLVSCDEQKDTFDDQTYLDVLNSLSAVMMAVQAMHELGMRFDSTSEHKFYEVMNQKNYELCLDNGVAGVLASVEILSVHDACEPYTFDAIICLGMDSVNTSLTTKDRAFDLLAQKLEGTEAIAPLAEGRRLFYRMLASARRYVSLEYITHDEHMNETFASVVLKELLSCYGGTQTEPVIPQITKGEEHLSANLLFDGKKPRETVSLSPQPTGFIPETLKPFVVIPSRQGTELIQTQKLSASQIESYLECPYKWFTQRRLGLDRVDAGFGGLEKGIFVHRVLELTHQQLLQEALGAIGDLSVDSVWEVATASLPQSRVSQDTLERSIRILDRQFDALAEEQFLTTQKKHKKIQRLVPHSVSQHQQMQRLQEDLHGLLKFETDKFLTFEPRFFELKFGMDGGESAQYAGIAFNGSIDRIDVNAKGEAVIIDYKHKASPALKAYAVQKTVDDSGTEVTALSPDKLPRHVQAIIYAQVVRKYLKAHNLASIGAMYVGTHHAYALCGAAPDSFIYRILGLEDGQNLNKTTAACVAGKTVQEFNEYLDAWEEQIRQAVERMLNGDIHAHALDKEACKYCPVMNCLERKH